MGMNNWVGDSVKIKGIGLKNKEQDRKSKTSYIAFSKVKKSLIDEKSTRSHRHRTKETKNKDVGIKN